MMNFDRVALGMSGRSLPGSHVLPSTRLLIFELAEPIQRADAFILLF